jgi:hypothetical protein
MKPGRETQVKRARERLVRERREEKQAKRQAKSAERRDRAREGQALDEPSAGAGS